MIIIYLMYPKQIFAILVTHSYSNTICMILTYNLPHHSIFCGYSEQCETMISLTSCDMKYKKAQQLFYQSA